MDFKFNSSKLSELRKKNGLSQEKFAELIGVSRQTIYLWESSQSVPDTENIAKICKVLNINTEDIVDGWKEKSSDTNKSKKKILKYIFAIFLIIVFIYIIFSLRKFFILQDISKKISEIKNLNNYSYTCTSFEIDDFTVKNLYETEVYFKDGIMKSNTKTEKNEVITYINYNKNKGYEINNNNQTEINLESQIYPNENTLHDITFMAIGENTLINFIYSFNPFVNISSNDETYIIKVKSKVMDINWNIEQKIDKDTGVMLSEIWNSKNSSKNRIYDVKIGKTEENDMIMPMIITNE